MSLALAELRKAVKKVNLTREEVLALMPEKVYDDGKTKQSFKDETDIQKIMARAEVTGTISHLAKYEGVYADFSDFNFHEQNNMLARGGEIFDALPAEIRKEFRQSPAAFFKYVNDPANADDLRKKLPALAQPGRQNIQVSAPSADTQAALDAAKTAVIAEPEPISASATSTGSETVKAPEAQ